MMRGANAACFLFFLLLRLSHGFQPSIGPFYVATCPRVATPWRAIGTSGKRHDHLSHRRIATCSLVQSQISNVDVEQPPSTPRVQKALSAAGIIVLLDVTFRWLLQLLAISFPSSLFGCGMLFATFLLAPNGAQLHSALSPGAALLAKWLPVFFVPSLITLPLAQSLGSISELLKVATIVVGGFYFTLLTTAWTVVGVRKLLPSSSKGAQESTVDEDVAQEVTTSDQKPAKAFSDRTSNGLRLIAAGSAIAAIVTSRIGSTLATPCLCLFMLSITLANFVFGARLPQNFVKIVHPLVTCTSLTWTAAFLFGKATGMTFLSTLKSYRTQKLSLFTAGAGDVLLFLLGPAVLSLACQMYDRRRLMKENIAEVGAAVGVSAFGGIFGTAAAVRALELASPYLRLSLLSRNITSPLAMAIAGILGADASLAVTIVVITGLIGANFGASILDKFGITDAVARGLGIGAAAHGLGTAAFVEEEDAFPFAAIAMALTASASTVIVSIPVFKRIVLQLALGA